MNLSRCAVTGAGGRLGTELVSRGCLPLVSDITDIDSLRTEMHDKADQFDLVIHAAAITDVDLCEKDIDLAAKVNLYGTANVLDCVDDLGKAFIFMSTDHVFSNEGWFSKNKEDRQALPVNNYGMSKLVAEQLVSTYDSRYKIVRTSKLFISPVEFLMSDTVFSKDIVKSYMYLPHFVNCLGLYINHFMQMPKILHIAGSKKISHYDFAVECAKVVAKSEIVLESSRYKEIIGKASRATKSGLDVKLAGKLGIPLTSYKDGLQAWTLSNR